MKPTTLLAVTAAVIFMPQPAFAQGGPGFLFAQPRVAVSAKAGYSFPQTDSDLFDFSREQFTLSRADFRSPSFGAEAAFSATEQLDVVVDFGWARSRADSEYWDFEDLDGLPIEQETVFERTTISFGARYYPLDRGRQVGQFAWVPSAVSPFVGAGVGVMWHEFRQNGDFIDFETFDVFSDNLQTSGVAPVADVRAGIDVSLSRRVFVTGEARYLFGTGPTGDDYVGFDDMDLSGLVALVGVGFRF
jgi:hypothetical protein